MATSSAHVHVAVDQRELETAHRCGPDVLPAFLRLLGTLGRATKHPGLLSEKAIDSVGRYLDEDARAEASRAQLVGGGGQGVRVEFRSRRFDVLTVEAADKLPSEQRRHCVAIRGTNEVARRLDASQRGAAELQVTLRNGATLALRQSKRAERMVVLITSAQGKKKALDAVLGADDASALAALFVAAARRAPAVAEGGGSAGGAGPSAASSGASSPPSGARSRWVKMADGGFWVLPAWYAEACALVAQDVFRLHALVSATSQHISRALFVDRVTAHRVVSGPVERHHTLVKAVLHRASGGCACALHKAAAPTQPFKCLEVRWEFCGCALDAHGKCDRHYLAERPTASAAFPKVCMAGLKCELHCAHDERAGLRMPLLANDPKMDLGFAQRFLRDLAACGAHLMAEGAHDELATDVAQLMQELEAQRVLHNHVGETMLQRDVSAVYLLRTRAAVSTKRGKFEQGVRADCNAILKTHKLLFRKKA